MSSDPDQRITSPHKPSKPIIKQKRTRSSRSGPSAEIQSSSINIQQDSGHTDEDSYTVDRNHRTRTEKSTKSPSSWTKKKSKKKEFEADSDHSSFASSSDLFPPPSAKPGQKDKQKESRAQTPASSTNHNRRSVKDDDEKPMKDNPTIALAQPTPQASPIRLVPSHPTFVALTSRGRQAICQFSSSIPLKLLQQTTAPTTVDVTVPKTDLPVSIVTIPPGHTFTPTNPTTSHFFLACGSLTYRAESRYSIENKSGTWMEDVLLEPMTNFVIPDQSGLIVTLENKSQELVVLNITSVHPKS
ncbi:hypothetical protein BLNAU_452 [Blattamonas nauphoetae]|uniref:Uncharacterized protein n=1 Tax=Blattamonas nauphoetae TaxID=2049346 RepID=A0ABQ9YLJ4_9EUKA|nr:hypothetical protein BLNAU_452 [Blattamonas nauphoetae]